MVHFVLKWIAIFSLCGVLARLGYLSMTADNKKRAEALGGMGSILYLLFYVIFCS
jgi:hypothetical protein